MTPLQRRRVRLLYAVLIVAIAIGLVLFGDRRPSSQEIRVLIGSELHAGASSIEIEIFFKRHGIPYAFDKAQNEYQGRIWNPQYAWFLSRTIGIYIDVDKDRRFISAKVYSSYTFL